MSMALLLTLLLPVLQDDPQVTYREGLFEEVDQGNLEKAAELYGKVLKSGAPDALKAKALLRTGFCHEKRGRRKEAEQAWRDVIERYPSAPETVKLARERLDSLNRASAPADPSSDAQVKELILDLGSWTPEIRDKAVRRLVLMGDQVIPEVRRALQHKDTTLSLSAAQVLVQLESYAGVNELLKRRWPPADRSMSPTEAHIWGRLLRNSEDERKRFIKDVESLPKAAVFPMLFNILRDVPDPGLSRIFEDGLVELPISQFGGNSMEEWVKDRGIDDVRRVTKRLSGQSPPAQDKIVYLLRDFAPYKGAAHPELKAALPPALVGFTNAGWLLDDDIWIPNWPFVYLTPAEFARGPLEAWITKGPKDIQERILMSVAREISRARPDRKELNKEMGNLLFEIMGAADKPKEVRERIFAYGIVPDSPERWERVLAYCLLYFKENRSNPPT
ncbi:MAG TPA: tetratricopeptide repeat protein, partial [Planctomycetota bacterium]|nr:tetratricopeptide repeat protein [Planctomycetota bacterium]